MSELEKSGAPTPAPADLPAPAPTPAAPTAAAPGPAAPVGSAPAFGSFGATRGSGLLRGKRPAIAAAASSPASSAGYKPSSLEVLTSKSEYKNPFTGETSVGAPARPACPPKPQSPLATPDAEETGRRSEPAERAAVGPAPEAAPPPATTTPPPAPAPVAEKPVTPVPVASTERAELKILPPENPRRAEVRWEAPREAADSAPAGGAPAPQRDDRPSFQPSRERREPRDPRDQRDPRETREARPFEPREPRRDERRFEPRTNQPYAQSAPSSEPVKKSGGFLGWLKGLFGGGKPTAPTPTTTDENRDRGDFRGQDDYGRRRHRGGRGRGGQGGPGGPGGYRDDQRGPRPEGQPRGEGGEFRGEPRGEGNYGGDPRRRRRGGRGRFRGEGGDRGPRPEGQQGGGAI